MTRQELEQLCQPQTPDDVLEGLKELYEEHVNLQGGTGDELHDALETQDETSDEEMENIAAGVRVMENLIENADLPLTVRARRLIW